MTNNGYEWRNGYGLLGSNTEIMLPPNPDVELRVGELNPTIVFAGLNATGKDFLAAQLINKGFGARLLGFGDLLSRSMNTPKESLPSLRPEDFEPYYPAIVAEALAERPTILTAHPVFSQGKTICFNPEIYTALAPLAFVVVTCEGKQINDWRTKRQIEIERFSVLEEESNIQMKQQITLGIIQSFAGLNGAGMIIVRNVESPESTQENVGLLHITLSEWLGNYCNMRS